VVAIVVTKEFQWVFSAINRSDKPGMGLGPFLDEPGVLRPHDGQPELGIMSELEPLTGKSRKPGGKVHRGVDIVEVHVPDAGIDVPSPLAHLLEPLGLKGRLGDGPPDDGVQSDVGPTDTVVVPDVSILLRDDLRRLPANLTGIRPSKAWRGSTTWSSTEMRV
jgi:hypothetical protein